MIRALALLLLLLHAASARSAEPVPTAVLHHAVVQGDSWWALAERYWGDVGLGRELAWFVGGDPDAPLEADSVLRIPVLQPHQIRPGDTLRRVAREYYGDAGFAPALARINELSAPDALVVGQSLLVPLAERRPSAAPATPPVRANARPAAPVPSSTASPPTPARAAPAPDPGLDERLRYAVNAYLDGSYDSALESLERLRTPVLARGDAKQQALLLRTLAFVYVAFERPADACDSIRALRAIDAGTQWSAELISPKILDVVSACSEPQRSGS